MGETVETGKPQSTRKDTTSQQGIKVEIYNQSYNIRGNGDSEYIIELAEFVDRRMRDVATATLTVDSLKVAILAALHIADELHQLKRRYEEMDTQLLEKTADYSELIDQVFRLRVDEVETDPTETITPDESDNT